jgi:hypothetical protein
MSSFSSSPEHMDSAPVPQIVIKKRACGIFYHIWVFFLGFLTCLVTILIIIVFLVFRFAQYKSEGSPSYGEIKWTWPSVSIQRDSKQETLVKTETSPVIELHNLQPHSDMKTVSSEGGVQGTLPLSSEHPSVHDSQISNNPSQHNEEHHEESNHSEQE